MGSGGESPTGGPGWRVPSRPCNSCKRAAAALFCRVDSAFLCLACDGDVHGANKLASRHERVRMCEVCEQAPAAVTCQADAAALCSACDADIHSVNSLTSRHHRLPIEPLHSPSAAGPAPLLKPSHTLHDGASLLSLFLPSFPEEAGVPGNPVVGEMVKPAVHAFFDDTCLDLNLGSSDRLDECGTDGQVPVQAEADSVLVNLPPEKRLHMDSGRSAEAATFSFPVHSCTQRVSSPSQDFGVVPDGSDVSRPYTGSTSGSSAEPSHNTARINIQATQLSGVDREARVLRYKEKRKNRKFEKTIRYASRKAYAETRPRIKGRFVKRSKVEGQVADNTYGACPSVFFPHAEFGVVPTTV